MLTSSSEDMLAGHTDEISMLCLLNNRCPITTCRFPFHTSGWEGGGGGFKATNMDIVSLSCSSAGSLNKIQPQHLKDLLQHVRWNVDMECPLLSALASEGNTLEVVQLFFFSVLLVALRKKSGGVRSDCC